MCAFGDLSIVPGIQEKKFRMKIHAGSELN